MDPRQFYDTTILDPDEVEVTRDGGGELDVQLDRNFDVVGQESDAGEADEQDD